MSSSRRFQDDFRTFPNFSEVFDRAKDSRAECELSCAPSLTGDLSFGRLPEVRFYAEGLKRAISLLAKQERGDLYAKAKQIHLSSNVPDPDAGRFDRRNHTGAGAGGASLLG